MIDALNKQILAEVKTYFNLQDVYMVLHEVEEYMNIAKRKTQVDFDLKKVEVPDQPIGFVKLIEATYDEGRNGFRGKRSGFVMVGEWGKYLALNVYTVRCVYEVVLYSIFGKQINDLVSHWLYFPRYSEILAKLGTDLEVKLPVSILVEEVGVPEVDFTLRDRGLKLYRLNGRLGCLSYLIPEDTMKSVVSGWGLVFWDSDYSKISYEPLRQIDVKFKVGFSVFREDGVEVQEVLPCLLSV